MISGTRLTNRSSAAARRVDPSAEGYPARAELRPLIPTASFQGSRVEGLFLEVAGASQVTQINVECCWRERLVNTLKRVNPTKFLTELKRRNVYRAAVAYGVVAWFFTQLTTQVFPFFEIPNSAVRFVVIALAIGFPIAMLLAWVYEFTPEGVVRTDLHPAQ